MGGREQLHSVVQSFLRGCVISCYSIFLKSSDFQPIIVHALFLIITGVSWAESQRNIFKSLLMFCFIIKSGSGTEQKFTPGIHKKFSDLGPEYFNKKVYLHKQHCKLHLDMGRLIALFF